MSFCYVLLHFSIFSFILHRSLFSLIVYLDVIICIQNIHVRVLSHIVDSIDYALSKVVCFKQSCFFTTNCCSLIVFGCKHVSGVTVIKSCAPFIVLPQCTSFRLSSHRPQPTAVSHYNW